MIVLGLHHETHDSGAAIVKDGRIVCAVNEERLSRKKHDKAAPLRSIAACFELAGVGPSDLDAVAFSTGTWRDFLTYETRLGFARMGHAFWLQRNPYKLLGVRRWRHVRRKRKALMKALGGFRGRVFDFKHEPLHVSGAYWTSGMSDPVVVVAEGSGWDCTATVAVRDGRAWNELAVTPWPNSPGQFYDCVTELLGFNAPWHAGKITGLAAFGDPGVCYDVVRPLLGHDDLQLTLDPVVIRWVRDFHATGELPAGLRDHSRENIAAAFQQRLEEVIVDFVKTAAERTGKREVALAGGTFGNVKLNQRILALDAVDAVFVHPGMSDIGQAVGAALEGYATLDTDYAPWRLDDVYFGTAYSNDDVKAVLDRRGLAYTEPDDMEAAVADALAEGKLVARFAGRMEYGPRALGNRSILYKPTDPKVNDWLNDQLNRTEFMPFAPVARMENASRLFVGTEGAEYAAEFMTISFDCTDEMKQKAPATVHVDGTARPQLIRREVNPGYYRILEIFEQKTGIPALVNTSFNMHEEPIVESPDNAVDAFLASRLDVLAIEGCLVTQSA